MNNDLFAWQFHSMQVIWNEHVHEWSFVLDMDISLSLSLSLALSLSLSEKFGQM